MPWMNKLRVGIEYVCKFVQYLCPRWIVDKSKDNNKWEKYTKNILKQIRTSVKWILNIVMSVDISFCDTPINLSILCYLATKTWTLSINKYENLHNWKNKTKNKKNCKSIF